MTNTTLDQSGKDSVRVTVVGVIANIILALLKGIVGLLSQSSALVADAAHSLSDLLSDAVTLWSVTISRKPVDDSHPYGHGKFETFGTLFIALMLISAGAGIAMHGIEQLDNPVVPGNAAIWMAACSIIVKELLYRYAALIGRRHQSRILLANAWHHRTDAISSVVALAGIIGAVLGYPLLDPIAAILVSGWIIKAGLTIGYDAFKELTDQGVEQDIIKSINDILATIAGVRHFHKVRARRMGPYMLVDLHIEVEETISVSVSHQIAERVRYAVLGRISSVNEVLVHVDTEDHDDQQHPPLMRPLRDIEADITAVSHTVPEVQQITHITCHYIKSTLSVQVDIDIAQDKQIHEARAIARRLKEALETIEDIHSADIHLEL